MGLSPFNKKTPVSHRPTAVATPFSQPATQTFVAQTNQPASQVFAAQSQRLMATARSPMDVYNKPPVNVTDVEALGNDLAREVSVTVDEITKKFTVANFGQLGDILSTVQMQADKLDVSDLTDSGMFGWVKRKFTDVRHTLMKRLNTASDAFNDLERRIVDQIAVLEEWNRDLESLYQDNLSNHRNLTALIKKVEKYISQSQEQLAAFPEIDPADPESYIKGQQYSEMEQVIYHLRAKLDTFNRLRIIVENNGPKIKAKQSAARATVSTFRRTISEVIPMIKMEFAMFIHNLELQKSVKLIDSVRDLSENALRQSADSTKDAIVSSTQAAATPIVSMDTLNHIRQKMLETVSDVQQIHSNAEAQRINDAAAMEQSRQEYFQLLTSKKPTIPQKYIS